ncbi:hypothetical protein [Arsenophonus sp. PmNCSU2021_1]|uniref:hypothetical protein n=1 Tax=Arsenophonus sp. PmNCSU2021_1 TaxID=3118989 RepID=UPI002FF2358F
MKIFSAYFHHNGFIVQAEQNEDFWVLLSRSLGWGKFCKIDDMEALTGRASRFECVKYVRQMSQPHIQSFQVQMFYGICWKLATC